MKPGARRVKVVSEAAVTMAVKAMASNIQPSQV